MCPGFVILGLSFLSFLAICTKPLPATNGVGFRVFPRKNISSTVWKIPFDGNIFGPCVEVSTLKPPTGMASAY